MTVTATSSAASTTQTATAAVQSKSVISSDFETFLQMLTTQARYQDPLEPIDSSEYSAQLAQFSMVEQQVKSNDLLTALSAQLSGGGISQIASWIGMEARTTAPAEFSGSPITVLPTATAGADRAELVAYNAQGTEVLRSLIPVSDEPVQWAGVSSNGTPFPAGTYSFKVESFKAGELVNETEATTYSRITEARIEEGATHLILAGGSKITTADVTALREAD
ncbi:flagellar basal-body rod modification protein FlgD [Sulfitobacter marinus]|uniref:Basal-body rod modification protein FlgD n=1 Tax=Sulfitobacter marinus TaxID=394264 RepID=A0A1I6TDF2_9RHOB|nr:flagellar hook capping FlgD N-terminal domain-containing protein [Sulfitobacter marinus]SFS87183.1 flagellar basal-body rod modification protein FlgD [Sulfitobacter marinus]